MDRSVMQDILDGSSVRNIWKVKEAAMKVVDLPSRLQSVLKQLSTPVWSVTEADGVYQVYLKPGKDVPLSDIQKLSKVKSLVHIRSHEDIVVLVFKLR